MNDTLDEGVARGEQQTQLHEANIKQLLATNVTAKVAPLLSAGPTWKKEILAEAPEALKVVGKVRKTEWARHIDVEGLCIAIEEIVNRNPAAIQQGLDMHKRLSWRDLLRNGEGEAKNTAANIVGELIGYLSVGRGAAGAIRDNVGRLLARIEYLEGMRDQDLPPPPPVSILPPPEPMKPTKIVTKTEMDAREV